MRKSSIIALFSLLVQFGIGQTWHPIDGGSLPVWIEYHIHTMAADISPLTDPHLFSTNMEDSTNAWGFGQSTKPTFENETGWVTDSINPYGDSLKSELVVMFPTMYGHQTSWILFEHKFDIDTTGDAGYLEYSCDSLHWNVVEPYEIGGNEPDPTFRIDPINFGENVIHDSIDGFAGVQSDWEWSGVQFIWWYSVFQVEETRDFVYCDWQNFDTIYVRFVFESDSITTNHDGWMIRNIKLGYDDFPGSIDDHMKSPLRLYPNPSSGIINFKLPTNDGSFEQLNIYDMIGRNVLSAPYQPSLDVSSLAPGQYIVVVESDSWKHRSKLVIR